MERGHNPQATRDHNRSLILRLIRDMGPTSRAELARLSKLSKPVVTDIVDGLIRHELVKETAKGEATLGRKPILLDINREAMWIMGIDLSRNHVDLIITDLVGEVHRRMSRRISFEDQDAGYPERVIKYVTDVIRDSGVDPSRIAGIGIGYPLPLSHIQRMIVSDGQVVGWKTVRLKELIQKEFNVPVYLDNDANAAALYQKWYGEASEFKDFLFILVGNGVGCGIVIGGNIYRGTHGIAGEIGHMSIDPNGPRCLCGSRGCLETLVSVPRLLSQVLEEDVKAGRGGDGLPTLDQVCERALRGDAVVIDKVREMSEYLAIAVTNLVNTFNPEAVVIGGPMAKLSDSLMEPLSRALAARTHPLFADKTKTILSRHSEDAVARGAAVLVIERFFENPQRYVPELSNGPGYRVSSEA
ncbi:MAG: ROK family transcriptional regulator [Bacillota bacterium]